VREVFTLSRSVQSPRVHGYFQDSLTKFFKIQESETSIRPCCRLQKIETSSLGAGTRGTVPRQKYSARKQSPWGPELLMAAPSALAPQQSSHPTALPRSPLAFACPRLETLYQHFRTTNTHLWTAGTTIFTVIGWASLFFKMAISGRKLLHLLPSPLLPAMFHFLPALVVLYLIAVHPTAYNKHKRWINACVLGGLSVATLQAREIFLWMKLVDNASGGGSTWGQQMSYFFTENLYMSMMWSYAYAFPVEPHFDVVMMTGGMLMQMAGNKQFCKFPLLGPNPVTMTPKVMAVAQWASDLVLSFASPIVPFYDTKLDSCPAALGFWQVTGWMLACLLVFACELFTRRHFLRTPVALASLGPDLALARFHWPFGRAFMSMNCLCVVFLFFFLQSAIWAVALSVLSQ
jgi:hypothetical protein